MKQLPFAKVIELYITHDNSSRLNKESLMVDKDGVLEDKFHGKKIERSVLITSTDAYRLAQENGIQIEQGSLGENILVDGSISLLIPGKQFFIGDVLFEITQNCTICKGLSTVDTKLPSLLKDDRGIFAKTVTNGTIKKGDTLSISQSN
jgi:MOSC domain-containing protein YiiM